MDKTQELQNQIEELKKIIETNNKDFNTLKDEFTLFKNHINNDNIYIDKNLELPTGKGIKIGYITTADADLGTQQVGGFIVGADENVQDGSDNMEVYLQHTPYNGTSTNNSFFMSKRGLIFNAEASVSSSSTSISLPNSNFPVNRLVGHVCLIRDASTGADIDWRWIVSNTASTITLDSNPSVSGAYLCIIFVPVYLGSATIPWRMLYAGGTPVDFSNPIHKRAIRLGYTTTATAPAIYYGTGTPLNLLPAVVGSLYIRTDGGTSTTLYVKESATDATGWVAK